MKADGGGSKALAARKPKENGKWGGGTERKEIDFPTAWVEGEGERCSYRPGVGLCPYAAEFQVLALTGVPGDEAVFCVMHVGFGLGSVVDPSWGSYGWHVEVL